MSVCVCRGPGWMQGVQLHGVPSDSVASLLAFYIPIRGCLVQINPLSCYSAAEPMGQPDRSRDGDQLGGSSFD